MENKKIILLVEDEIAYQRILLEKLKEEDFEIIVAKNGEEGLNLALTNHPDLIILDLLMPIMSGTKMLEKLKEDEWGKGAKVIVLTNLTDTGKIPIADSEKEGVYEYIVKFDIKIEDLVKRAKLILNN